MLNGAVIMQPHICLDDIHYYLMSVCSVILLILIGSLRGIVPYSGFISSTKAPCLFCFSSCCLCISTIPSSSPCSAHNSVEVISQLLQEAAGGQQFLDQWFFFVSTILYMRNSTEVIKAMKTNKENMIKNIYNTRHEHRLKKIKQN